MTLRKELPSSFLEALDAVEQRRPRVIIDHLLLHGQITTEEIREIYGYSHPPKAVRDVREHGIPLETFRVTGSDGRSIAAYRFGDPADLQSGKQAGRTVLRATLKSALIRKHGAKCGIYSENVPATELQVDHRIRSKSQARVQRGRTTRQDTCYSVHQRIGRNRGVARTVRTGV